MKAAAIRTTPPSRNTMSPRLVLPGCIALNPTSPSVGDRFCQAIVPAELLLRKPGDVLLHRGGEGPGLLLAAAGALEDGGSLRIDDRHRPPPTAGARVGLHAVPVGGHGYLGRRPLRISSRRASISSSTESS